MRSIFRFKHGGRLLVKLTSKAHIYVFTKQVRIISRLTFLFKAAFRIATITSAETILLFCVLCWSPQLLVSERHESCHKLRWFLTSIVFIICLILIYWLRFSWLLICMIFIIYLFNWDNALLYSTCWHGINHLPSSPSWVLWL